MKQFFLDMMKNPAVGILWALLWMVLGAVVAAGTMMGISMVLEEEREHGVLHLPVAGSLLQVMMFVAVLCILALMIAFANALFRIGRRSMDASEAALGAVGDLRRDLAESRAVREHAVGTLIETKGAVIEAVVAAGEAKQAAGEAKQAVAEVKCLYEPESKQGAQGALASPAVGHGDIPAAEIQATPANDPNVAGA